MLVVTTPFLEGRRIVAYKGPVFAQVAEGAGFGRGLSAAFRAFASGRSSMHEDMIKQTREVAMQEIMEEARRLGANAIVGLTMDYETMGQDAILVFKGTGTAVVVE
ncbi:MAG: YbjQ family protein [Turicibacter sp.]|nr:YbjQ family protein [Turicibacter sp.]